MFTIHLALSLHLPCKSRIIHCSVELVSSHIRASARSDLSAFYRSGCRDTPRHHLVFAAVRLGGSRGVGRVAVESTEQGAGENPAIASQLQS
jgi:hypothetical protein